MVEVRLSKRFCGPATMGHGGYVAGLLAEQIDGCAQVTLRRPTPFDTPLSLAQESGRAFLRDGETLVAEAEPSTLGIDLPTPPTPEQARAGVEGSPSFYNDGRGVHPSCFGCAPGREEGDGLRIFVGPCEVDGHALVAAPWTPGPAFTGPDGDVPTRFVLGALDCPGAFAFIVERKRAGLLGRIVFEKYAPVRGDAEHVVVGWQIGEDGRKLFAGTALFDAAGSCLASARATWFGFKR